MSNIKRRGHHHGQGKILEVWEDYIKDQYGDNERNDYYRIRINAEGAQILKIELEYAMNKTKVGKVPGHEKSP